LVKIKERQLKMHINSKKGSLSIKTIEIKNSKKIKSVKTPNSWYEGYYFGKTVKEKITRFKRQKLGLKSLVLFIFSLNQGF
jgi:hypothetical protein